MVGCSVRWGAVLSLVVVVVCCWCCGCSWASSASLNVYTRVRPSSPSWTRNDDMNNDYPVILIPGVFGWGRGEMLLGRPYFGMFSSDIQEDLKSEGFTVYTANPGPVSSNWDRACELYAIIKGGQVDYGAAHAARHGHKRYGRWFKGLFPEWGTRDEKGRIRKVHLIGHSLGGLTARALAKLLSDGSAEERQGNEFGSLFEGQKEDWIFSITTFATPHLGSTLVDSIFHSEMDFFLQRMIVRMGSILNMIGEQGSDLYDLKFDHWGIGRRRGGESMSNYIRRVSNSPMFNESQRDTVAYDLSLKGLREFNEWAKLDPSIYYFNYGTTRSRPSCSWNKFPCSRIHVPVLYSMSPVLQPLSYILGSRHTIELGLDEDWLQNDGAVNTISTLGPQTVHDHSVIFNGTVQPNVWNHMGVLDMDHLGVVGLSFHNRTYLYCNHVHLLFQLEKSDGVMESNNSSHRRLQSNTPHSVRMKQDVLEGIENTFKRAAWESAHGDRKSVV